MEVLTITDQLAAMWERETGFLGKLRDGVFDDRAYTGLRELLANLDFSEDEVVDRRVVALIWHIPTFMEWQEERVGRSGGDVQQLKRAVNEVRNELERILGVP